MKFTGKRILVVAPDFPYPPNHGGRVDMWGGIRILFELGLDIDLVVTSKIEPSAEDMDAVKKYVNNVICYNRRPCLLDNFSLLPLQVRSRDCLRHAELCTEYDIVFLETQYVVSILNNPRLQAKHLVLRVHNDETTYFRELSRSVRIGWYKLYYILESWKFALLDRIICKKIKNMMFISQDEFSDFRRRHPEMNSVWLPVPIPPIQHYNRASDSRTVVFVGSLFMPNNQDAIRWYVNKVHPLLSDIDGYKFLVAGNSRGRKLDWLYRLADGDCAVRIYDSPDDLGPIYEQGCVFVNSMRHGAGVKLKAIDAIQNGLPVVSTTIGNQGTGLIPGQHVLIADDPEGFALHVRTLLMDERKRQDMVSLAQSWLSEHYDRKAILEKYFAALLK